MLPISAIIITKNEEDRIAGAIASLAFCDEILIVDSESTDETRAIAQRLGARVLIRPWDSYTNQKNFAAEQARYDWIFSLDADERVSAELTEEIVAWKGNGTTPGAASMPRRAFYLGRWIHHSGWYPDRKIRLYDRRAARWEGAYVHERLRVTGAVRRLKGDLLHFPYRSWEDHEKRIDRYTLLAAEAAKADGRTSSRLRMIALPTLSFLRTFVARGGFLDGWRGAVISYAGARYVFLREFRILR
jgi:glycosyltransferase involved in cell wall biosynthesis